MPYTTTPEAGRIERPLPPVIISLHGIRTAGAWQKQLATPIAAAGAIPVALDYGYFGVLQLLTRSAREARIRWLRDEIERVRARFPDRPLSMIAHSFGSYLTAALLERHPSLCFSTLLLAGSIVRNDYPWPALLASYRVGFVANSVGRRDPWPGLARQCIAGAGDSGCRGFDDSHAALYQLDSAHRHGGHFNATDFDAFWLPMLVRPQRLLLDVLLALQHQLRRLLAPRWRDGAALRARLLVAHPVLAGHYWTAPGLAVADPDARWAPHELQGLLPFMLAQQCSPLLPPALQAVAGDATVTWLRGSAAHGGHPQLLAAVAVPLPPRTPDGAARGLLSMELLQCRRLRVDDAAQSAVVAVSRAVAEAAGRMTPLL